MNFIPSLPILGSIVAALALPVLLAALSHGPWKVMAPGRRFAIAAALAVTAWAVTVCVYADVEAADLAAGVLILLAAVLAEFTIWTLIAWGFTVSMLMALAREDRALSVPEWVAAYTGGRTIAAFAQDRLCILFRFGLAAKENDCVVMNPGRGRRTARAARLLRTLFGLNS